MATHADRLHRDILHELECIQQMALKGDGTTLTLDPKPEDSQQIIRAHVWAVTAEIIDDYVYPIDATVITTTLAAMSRLLTTYCDRKIQGDEFIHVRELATKILERVRVLQKKVDSYDRLQKRMNEQLQREVRRERVARSDRGTSVVLKDKYKRHWNGIDNVDEASERRELYNLLCRLGAGAE